ncbi:ATP-binding protein [Bacillus sp. 31A1R]|uniref:histidine kinase n=1 Tax=Robertmurraya mangrovi TaxID=3098077 RepID=A0ABU5IXW0_9BACI|nr:ATP-binding protein [Bacillus sp. 31A1R]MDZ5472003.1 ATP-binding protein [Bacillus sp. 31A1R]
MDTLNINNIVNTKVTVKEAIELIPFPTLLGKDGFFVHANQLALTLFEADDLYQIVGKFAFDFAYSDEDVQQIINDFEVAKHRKDRFSTKRILTVKKNVKLVESTLIPVQMDGIDYEYIIVKSYTEASVIKEQYSMQQKHYQTLIDNSIDTVALLTDFTFKYINKAGLELLGAQCESEIIGKSILDFMHPKYHLDVITRGQKIIHNQEVDLAKERVMVRIDGEPIYVETVVMPFSLENRPSLQVIIRNVTEQKRSLKRTIQTEKLLTAGQLSAGIAHEIRNPLTAIKGFLQFFEGSFPPSQLPFLKIVNDEIDKIERITGEMLSLSKPQAIIYSKHNPISLIHEVITLLESQANLKNVELLLNYDCKNILLNCDRSRIKQVFINLIKNAIDSIDQRGGTVTLNVRCHDEQYVFIDISDNGCGIPSELLEKINEPFYTTKGTGTGLGLTICNNIVKEHFGEISIQSKVNEGTTFTVKLPVDEFEPEA